MDFTYKRDVNREEKSLRHFAMAAKFLYDKKTQKCHLKSEFALLQTSSSLINFILRSDVINKSRAQDREKI